MTHNLGVKPVVFQAMYERVKDSRIFGFAWATRYSRCKRSGRHHPVLLVQSVGRDNNQYAAVMAADRDQSGLPHTGALIS